MKRLLLVLLLLGCAEEEGNQYHPEHAEQLLIEVSECLGMSAPMPNFYLVPEDSMAPYMAMTDFDSPTIWVDEDWAENKFVIRHELIHWVLAYNDYPRDLNAKHEGISWDCQSGA